MIRRLRLKSPLLQADVDLVLHRALNVFTGETGAGKSLLLEGIPFAFGLGQSRLSQGEATVEIAFQGKTETVSRTSRSGKNSYKINGKPAKAKEARQIGEWQVAVQAQGGARELLDERKHLELLDAFLTGKDQDLLKETVEAYRLWREKEAEWRALREKAETVEQERSFLEFQLRELKEQNLKPGLDEDLKQQLNALEHAEQIQASLHRAYELLYEGDGAAVEQIAEAEKCLEKIEQVFPEARRLREQLKAVTGQLGEVTDSLAAQVSYEPMEAEEIESHRARYFAVLDLKQKHKKSVEELIALQNELEQKLNFSENREERLKEAEQEAAWSKKAALAAAKKLGRARAKAAQVLEKEVLSHLSDLMLPEAQFQVARHTAELQSTGMDQVQFLFSVSPSLELKPLSKIASGGELSRVFLALSLCLASRRQIPTLILDEVETGVGGEAAIRMGQKLRELSQKVQVLLVTHQPAIAAHAHEHFCIDRNVESDGAVVVTKLDQKGKLEELSRMLRGASKTKPAQALAEELLASAGDFALDREQNKKADC